MKKIILLIPLFIFAFSGVYAEEVSILYTGETHAMVYPCHCPLEPDGGVARRATLIKQIRKDHPHTLLLDSGSFFAGGVMDEYTQNVQLDTHRTIANLKAMERMQYDAAAVSDDEFNFGKDFLATQAAASKMAYLSCNVKAEKILPYIIKETAGVKFGILGVSPPAVKSKAEGAVVDDPFFSVKESLGRLKAEGAEIIVVLSQLGNDEDLKLADQNPDIDIIIGEHKRNPDQPHPKAGRALIVNPDWQGRKLGILSLTIKDKKITGHKDELTRLSGLLANDPDVSRILPGCFTDSDCKKEGLLGICQDPGSLNAACHFIETAKVNLTVILPKECRFCNTQGVIKYLRQRFPGLSVTNLYYPGPKADQIVKDFGIIGLPVYLLGQEAAGEKSFNGMKDNLEAKGDFYMLKPYTSGVAYYINRKKEPGKLDLFIGLFAPETSALLAAIKDFKPAVHFLVTSAEKGFSSPGGKPELEEELRAVCVQKYYPQSFWNYLTCRVGNKNSSWWEDCLPGADTAKIKACAQGGEGVELLRQNIKLNKEIEVMIGPAYLVDNHEIFASSGTPAKADFEKILKREENKKP